MHQYHHQTSSTIVPETHVKVRQHKNAGEYIGFMKNRIHDLGLRKCLTKTCHESSLSVCFYKMFENR